MAEPTRRPEADRLGDYWDALVRGHATDDSALDPTLTEAIRRLGATDDAPPPDPAFARRLRKDLFMDAASAFTLPASPRLAPNGRAALPPLGATRPAAPAVPVARDRHGWALARLAVVALLLLAFAGGSAVVRFGWPGDGDGNLARIAAPAVSPVATPPAGPVEFLWQSRGAPDDPMGKTALIAVAPDGTIWVPDGESSQIRIFAPDGTLREVWGGPGTGEGQFDFSWDSYAGQSFGSVAFDAAGNIYVLDSGNLRVQKFDSDRRFLTAWGSEGRGDGQFIWPSDLTVDAQGRVFVLDGGRYNARSAPDSYFVQVFDGDGHFLFDWGVGTNGSETDKLFGSWGIAIDPDGTVLLADGERSRVQRFTSDGEHLQTIGGFGTDGVTFSHVPDVAVDAQGRIFVTEWYGARVTVLDREGRLLARWGEQGQGAGQFGKPYGLALDGQGNLYVTDYVTGAEGRLQAFRILTLPEPEATPAL